MSLFRYFGTVVALIALPLAALAAPFATTPSAVQVGQSVTVAGGGFQPGSVVTVRVTGPGKRVSVSAVVVAADGSIAHSLFAASAGAHVVQLLDAAGAAAVRELKFVAAP